MLAICGSANLSCSEDLHCYSAESVHSEGRAAGIAIGVIVAILGGIIFIIIIIILVTQRRYHVEPVHRISNPSTNIQNRVGFDKNYMHKAIVKPSSFHAPSAISQHTVSYFPDIVYKDK
jgi:hypothetical protein